MGAAMGWAVHDVKRCSMWEFFAAWHGYVDANTPKDNKKLTATEADDLFEWITAGDGTQQQISTQTYWWDETGPVPMGVVHFTTN
ncbi:MAG: hypothetical protein ACOH2N_00075 [Devosia sp.]